MKKKSFGVALLWWFLTGAIGGHRVYITGSLTPLLWYWLVSIGTVGIFPLIDLFRMNGFIEKEYYKYGGGNNQQQAGPTIVVNTGTMMNSNQE